MTNTSTEDKRGDVERLQQISEKGVDVAGEVAPKSAAEKALVRKIDLYLMPTIWILYLLAVGVQS